LSTPALALVLDYVEANHDRPTALADLAAVAGLSVFHFARVFKQSAGESPHVFVLRRRIERAKRLLSQSRLPLREIAPACGFSSQSHLTARFRKLTGVTPRGYRRIAGN
jgi:AraC family transcriptional regulator